jgi:23S rRNA (cytosine1962-C5)-methyltransferase
MSLLSTENVSVQLTPPVVRTVKKGHPWIFSKGILKQNKPGKPGDLAILYDQKRKFVGIGLLDPDSPISIRVLHRGKPAVLDRQWLIEKLDSIFRVRKVLVNDPQTTGYRLVSGENDGLPGLVIDRYDNTLVFKLDTVSWIPHLDQLVSAVCDLIQPDRIVLRVNRSVSKSPACPEEFKKSGVIYGADLDGPIIFLENGLKFEAEPIIGQKTGFFLDQRDNREKTGRLSKGRDVLNVFSYTGGFSLYAACNGAKSVTSLDLSKPALEAAARNFELNNDISSIVHSSHILLCDDAFDALTRLAGTGRKYGVVILDPPSFAKKQVDIPGALKAYERLVRLGLKVLEKDGVLVSASCSARVTAEMFFNTVTSTAAAAGYSLRILEKTTHALDHPIGFPEGAYLKCIFAKNKS